MKKTADKPESGQKKTWSGRNSLHVQFTVIFVLLILCAIGLTWLLNHFFLEQYYLRERQKRLVSDYNLLQEASRSGELADESFVESLREIADRDEIGIVVMDSNSSAVSAYVTEDQTLLRRMWDNLLGETPALPDDYSAENAQNGSRTQYYLVRTVEKTENYRIQIVLDSRLGIRYMEMWGILEDGSVFLLRCAIENLRLSTVIASRFLALSGLFVALFGAVAAYFLAGYVSKPIRDLTEISDRMKKLDFSAKYQGRSGNEIAELGENINELSGILEETIGELKSANRELKEDIARREKAEEMRQEFLTGVTHELKTPLALIQGYAEGLAEGVADDPESTRYYCDVIVDESKRMNGMVQRLLTLNELEFGRSNVEMVRFDLVMLIRGYLESAKTLAVQSGVKVLFDVTEPVYVWSDEFLVREVFSNYYTNAIHHAEGDRVVEITLQERGDCVRVSVFNTGSPIPAESLPRIWEQFYKVDKARTRAYGGNGVGLSIVKAIMGLLQRDFGAENYDNGVMFWFELERAGKTEKGKEQV
ncbi:MAG: HAMP domain-containing protein [Lachnospiraceae bacterium]|nr:HAMP domain-containing protein [Lachnospiraceae bacterium]